MSTIPKTEVVEALTAPTTVKAITGTIIGSGLAVVPFYESYAWAAFVAITGVSVTILTGVYVLISIRNALRNKR